MSERLEWIDKLHRLLLRVYPSEYIETFGNEIHQTFQDGLYEARSQGGLVIFLLRELLDTPKVLISAYVDRWIRPLINNIQVIDAVTSWDDLPPVPPDGRTSRKQALFELFPFIVTSAILILATYFPIVELAIRGQDGILTLVKLIMPLTLPLLLLGLLRGLPRWTYPICGFMLGYQTLILHQTIVWIVLLSMLVALALLSIAAIVTDPSPGILPIPLRKVIQSFSADWTRLSFACYGAMPLVILAAFDDSHSNNRTFYFALSVLAMIAGAIVYSRSREKHIQVSALLIGLTVSILGALLDNISFGSDLANWIVISSQGDTGNFWILAIWIRWAVLLLFPLCLAAQYRMLRRKRALE
jgi:hypothetical protein